MRTQIFKYGLLCLSLFIAIASLEAQTIEASINSSRNSGNGISRSPSASSDARYIAFESSASDLVSADTNEVSDIFVHHQEQIVPGTTSDTRETFRVSVSSDGTQADGASSDPHISASGRFVVFVSSAANLVTGDTNNKDDIFLRDRTNDTTTRISIAMNIFGNQTAEADGNSYHPHISSDGCYIVFASDATNLAANGSDGTPLNDTNGKRDIFLYYNPNGESGCIGGVAYLELLSVGPSDVLSNGDSDFPYFGSVRFISYSSKATNLIEGGTNGFQHIFLRDRAVTLGGVDVARINVLASQSSAGIQGNADSYTSSMDDGGVLAFDSDASNLVSSDTNSKRDIFLFRSSNTSRTQGTISRESVTLTGKESDGDSSHPSLADGANYLVFASDATNLAERTDCNGASDIFVRDYLLNLLTRRSLTTSAFQSDLGKGNFNPFVSGGGNIVVYESDAQLIPETVDNGLRDVFASVASEDPKSVNNPLTKAERLNEAPDVCVTSNKAEVFMEYFSEVSQSETQQIHTSKKSKTTDPCKKIQGTCYSVDLTPIKNGKADRSRDKQRKSGKLNATTFKNLKAGDYLVSYKLVGRSGKRSFKIPPSPSKKITISKRKS